MVTLGILAKPSAKGIPRPRIPMIARLMRSFAPIVRLFMNGPAVGPAQDASAPATIVPAATLVVLFRNSRRDILLSDIRVLLQLGLQIRRLC
jgi:hypothetical protein